MRTKCDIIIVGVLTCLVFGINISYSQLADEDNSLGTVCTTGDDCSVPHSLCLPLASGTLVCACNTEDGFFLEDEQCLIDSHIHDLCPSSVARCVDPNTVCDYDNAFTSSEKRCVCSPDTEEITMANGTRACARQLTNQMDPNCTTCQINQGKCFDTNGDNLRDGCHCPGSLSGENCETVHVFVTCANETLRVCYLPHPGVDFVSGSSKIFVENYDTALCRGNPADAECGPGMYVIHISLAERDLSTCGTARFRSSPDTIKFENMIEVMKTNSLNSEILLFKTYCTYKSNIDSTFMATVEDNVIAGFEGQSMLPMVTLTIRDVFERTIQNGVLMSGDTISFWVNLDTNAGYTSMSVEHCTLTTSRVLGDPQGQNLLITDDGCPTSGQSYIGLANNWRKRSDSVVSTGNLKVYPLGGSFNLFIHCTVRVCIPSDEALCVQSCSSRKKRQTDSGAEVRQVEVSGQIIFTTNSEGEIIGPSYDLQVYYIAVVCIALVFLVLLISLIVLIYRKCRPMVEARRNKIPPVWQMRSKEVTDHDLQGSMGKDNVSLRI